jgi:Xaa-Pro aminopeptidase
MKEMAKLVNLPWPEFGGGAYPPRADAAEFLGRLEKLRAAMRRRELTHLVVYGDREHFANLCYLTGIDPRFEEMVLVISEAPQPLMIVGNECEAYLPFSPIHSRLRHERYPTFSLLNQPRGQSRAIADIFAGEKIGPESLVGCVGWKYFDSKHAVDLPAYLVDALRDLAGRMNVVNATDLLMHPDHGLRTVWSASEIAYFEWSNVQVSESLRRMIWGMREGMTDHELSELARFSGEPQGCHMTLATGTMPGLCGPTGRRIRRGEMLSTNISYWGSNICRAGWIASGPEDLGPAARNYVDAFAGPYFEAMSEWFGLLRIGTPGGKLSDLIQLRLPFEKFGVFLNAGHLIHLEEWISSPIYLGSEIPLHSGMAIQVDVIPSSPVYGSTRMEDGVVLADASLRGEIESGFPEAYHRIQQRRRFMIDSLGIDLPEEVLPLSNIPAVVPPFLLNPGAILAMQNR